MLLFDSESQYKHWNTNIDWILFFNKSCTTFNLSKFKLH